MEQHHRVLARRIQYAALILAAAAVVDCWHCVIAGAKRHSSRSHW
jgi:hypothetical protein